MRYVPEIRESMRDRGDDLDLLEKTLGSRCTPLKRGSLWENVFCGGQYSGFRAGPQHDLCPKCKRAAPGTEMERAKQIFRSRILMRRMAAQRKANDLKRA